jgi:oligopeptide/dipeptide ABC transporter ATP-binding protein
MLEVRDLHVHYHTSRGAVKAVNGVNMSIARGERLGLVGESGSGKSTIALALLQLIRPPGRIERGEIVLEGTDLRQLTREEMRQARLAKIALVAQGAMNSLNPVARVRDQLRDALRDHDVDLSGKAFDNRVCIAIAISLRPKLIIADEPTSALDVVVQRQVMATLLKVQEELGASLLLIGHDMDLMAQVVDRVGIMYAGNFSEVANVSELFGKPLHPYSQMLIASLPSLETKGVFQGIPGLPPSLLQRPEGCAFRSRCPRAFDRCVVEEPPLREVQPGRQVACHLY